MPSTSLPTLPTACKLQRSIGSPQGVPDASPSPSDSELDISSLSSLEFCIPPPRRFSFHSHHAPISNRLTSGSTRERLHAQQSARKRCADQQNTSRAAVPPKSILKKHNPLGVQHAYDVIRKSKSVELLDGSTGQETCCLPTCSLGRGPSSNVRRSSSVRRSCSPPSPRSSKHLKCKMQFLEEKVRFSSFLDEITCRVLSPAHLTMLGKEASGVCGSPMPRHQGDPQKKQPAGAKSVDRRQRWDGWVAALQQSQRFKPLEDSALRRETPEHREAITKGAVHVEQVLKVNGGEKLDCRQIDDHKHGLPVTKQDVVSRTKDVLSNSNRIRILQQQNEDLRRRLSLSTHKMEAMEAEFDGGRHYMEAELSRTRDDLDKMRDKFRRLQNSYTASQRANQDLEEKLHALLRKVERDKKTMDQEIVELTNKLLEAKNTIDRLEELNERYRQDCNLAVQLLKCNKSHFRNHKFADLPSELQDMLNKHMKSSLPERSPAPSGQDPDTLSLTPSDVVPTSVIARVLEKPEPLLLNSAQSSSCGWPVAEDVFVHVDMTGPQAVPAEGRGRDEGGAEETATLNGSCQSQSSLDAGEEVGSTPSFDKLNPYPPPPPPNPLYPGRKVIEFSSDDKVKIPKNSPLPNCTYATRQAISLSLVQNDDPPPGSPTLSRGGGGIQPSRQDAGVEPPSNQSSPFSSPPQAPSVLTSSGSSEEDLLANWQRVFVDKMAAHPQQPQQAAGGASSSERHRAAYSDGEEGSSAHSWTPSRGSSLDTDTDTEPRPYGRGQYGGSGDSVDGGERLLMKLDEDGVSGDTAVAITTHHADARQEEEEEEEREVPPRLMDFDSAFAAAALPRPHRSPKRMGVHHLHRKDGLSHAHQHLMD
ncbi:tight junction-associated protein 1 isoform X2 [Dunckerocampus dactyliophorus]|uniref:tight junction-associated protein 1 isoform X2 n=1 Tax=Dunckerocampus dactyliophorus TaxID=161453 RepID=UPI002406CB67|nr:tight junction-associated protein 1 isoform X2 [Dunckerocampus dactyliophorus]